MMLHVTVRFADGSVQSLRKPAAIVERLAELRLQGIEGRALLVALLESGDWDRPISGIAISGALEDGRFVNDWVSCRSSDIEN
jgi:hypothetical protein